MLKIGQSSCSPEPGRIRKRRKRGERDGQRLKKNRIKQKRGRERVLYRKAMR